MNYEQKYKQALERARDYHSKNYMLINSAIENIFPELKESEDERIRKELIEFLKLPHSRFVGNREHEKWITWLEKQGEHKMLDADKVIGWLNDQACLGWIEDVEVDKFVDKFKKDFGL